MAIDRRFKPPGGSDGQTESMERREALSQKEPVGQITRRHQVSEGLIYRWRDKFFEGRKVALAFDGRNGTKDILGIWIEQSEGAKFSLRVITEIKNRGVSDTLIAVADGL